MLRAGVRACDAAFGRGSISISSNNSNDNNPQKRRASVDVDERRRESAAAAAASRPLSCARHTRRCAEMRARSRLGISGHLDAQRS